MTDNLKSGDLKTLIGKAATGAELSESEAREAFDIIMSGDATPSQIGGFLMALRVRGESVGEIAGASGQSLSFEQVTPEHYSKTLEQSAVPKDMAALVMYLFTSALDGRNAYVTETEATGVWSQRQ